MRKTSKLREIINRRAGVITPGGANALFARVIEDQGFECAYVTGAGVANMALGVPDIGLTTLNDVAQTVSSISDAVELPLIVDADTGFGNALNAYRTVQVLERAGAAGIQLEDQVFPKRCEHFAGKAVEPAQAMVQKIRAACDARLDADLVIIARTDALALEGVAAAIDRANLYVEAGADMIFIEAPTTEAELRRIGSALPVPQIANMVFGGKTPELGAARMAELGFSIILYANAALQAALKASSDVLATLKRDGSLQACEGLLASFDMRQRSVSKPLWDAREEKYAHER